MLVWNCLVKNLNGSFKYYEMIQLKMRWESDRWTVYPIWTWVAGWHKCQNERKWESAVFLISLPASIFSASVQLFRYQTISFSPSSLSSSIHAYGRLCDRNFNLKHMRGNPSLRCSLMGRHGIGVCREWLNFVRRPGTIKSRLPLCNRPFPSHNATSGKT